METKQLSGRKMSQQMSAVMTVISSHAEMLKLAKSYIDLENERIDWDGLFKQANSSAHKAAFGFAFALWRDELRPRINIFEGVLNMDQGVQLAILQAMMIRWNLSKPVEFLQGTYSVEGGAA